MLRSRQASERRARKSTRSPRAARGSEIAPDGIPKIRHAEKRRKKSNRTKTPSSWPNQLHGLTMFRLPICIPVTGAIDGEFGN